MGATRNTGYLENLIQYDASDNVAIATSVNPSYKVTLGGSMLGTSAVFSSTVTSSNEFRGLNGYGIRSYSAATATGNNILFAASVFASFDGIYQSSGSTNDFGIWTNGGTINQPKFVIKNGGNVGIGTTSPGGQLDVYATGTDLQTYFSQASSGNNNFTRWTRASGPTLIAGVVRSTNDGNQKANTAFIGTSNAYDFLLYSGDLERMRITSAGDMYLTGRSTNGDYGMYFYSNDTDSRIYSSNSGAVSKSLIFYTSGNPRMTITSGGNIAINNSTAVSTSLVGALTIWKTYGADGASVPSPTAQNYYNNQDGLYLFGRNSGLSIISANGEEGTIHFANVSTIAYATIGTTSGTSSVGGDMYFKVGSNTERMRILSDATSTLQITGATANNDNYPRLRFKGGTYPDADSKYPYIQLGNGGLALSIFGGYSATYNNPTQIALNNGVIAFFTASNSSTPVERMYISATGTTFIYSVYSQTSASAANVIVGSDGNLFRSTSSLKYKKDVVDYTKGLAEVMKLRPVNYQGKNEIDGNKRFAGLIAEEVHDLGLTEFVQYAEDGSPDALAYQNMVALLTKAIQELNQKIQALENR
jgi:Chaperone of endosialidase